MKISYIMESQPAKAYGIRILQFMKSLYQKIHGMLKKKSLTNIISTSDAEIRLARQILNLAKKAGYKSKQDKGMKILVARRLDYTEENNPDHIFSMMYNINQVPLLPSVFYFENWPSYNLHELLNAILESIQNPTLYQYVLD